MERPDESRIRDKDLLKELKRHRGRSLSQGMFDLEVTLLLEEQAKRDLAAEQRAAELATMPREKRRRALTQDHFLSEEPQAADIRHLHSVLAICGMPYDRLPIEEREFKRVQGNMGIMVQAGASLGANGEWVNHPLPFGPKARLILMHLCSEAIRQKSPKIEIAETFTEFVREMGFSDSGGKKGPLTAFREQLNALATCSIRISSNAAQHPKQKQFFPFEDIDVWLSTDPAQPSLWPSTVTFSNVMYESLQRHALPVNAKAVKAFQGSARKLDLYFWLGWRIHNINEPLHISWEAIIEQFGSDYVRPRKFREVFAHDVSHLKEVFPKLPLDLTKEGLVLSPSGPETLALPPVRTRLKK
jgi:hypothetical protein